MYSVPMAAMYLIFPSCPRASLMFIYAPLDTKNATLAVAFAETKTRIAIERVDSDALANDDCEAVGRRGPRSVYVPEGFSPMSPSSLDKERAP
jgi:hypothetical protein